MVAMVIVERGLGLILAMEMGENIRFWALQLIRVILAEVITAMEQVEMEKMGAQVLVRGKNMVVVAVALSREQLVLVQQDV